MGVLTGEGQNGKITGISRLGRSEILTSESLAVEVSKVFPQLEADAHGPRQPLWPLKDQSYTDARQEPL